MRDHAHDDLLGAPQHGSEQLLAPHGRDAGTAILPELPDAGLLPDLAAEVIELRAVDVADRGDLDPLDLRRVQRERPLHAHSEGLLPHRERLPGAGTLAFEDDALEHLDPGALP